MDAYREFILLLAATIRVATPLILAAFAGMFSERSGVIDLALEGKMLAAAFASAAVAATTVSTPGWDSARAWRRGCSALALVTRRLPA